MILLKYLCTWNTTPTRLEPQRDNVSEVFYFCKSPLHISRHSAGIISTNFENTVHCFCFAVKKFHGLTSFLSFPEKLLRLPVTLLILGTLDSNIHGKTFAVIKRSAKTAKLFTVKQKQYTVQ